MRYVLPSLILATLFGLIAHALYGTDGLIQRPWVDTAFWGIILAGGVLAGLDALRCVLCRGRRRNATLLCRWTPCGQA